MSSFRRRLRSPAVPPPPLEDGDLLSEILLRLPPNPSSLPRASLVCSSWRGLVADPRFLRRFRLRHRRNAPLLGFFHRTDHGLLSFVPTLEAPNRVPPGRFSLRFENNFRILDCRHGLVLIFDQNPLQFLVWDPVTGQQNRLAVPPGFSPNKANVIGAVLQGAGDVQHFKVVLVEADMKVQVNSRILVCVYSSETGVWGDLISTPIPSRDCPQLGTTKPALLFGDALYWMLAGESPNILEFVLETESLSLIRRPRFPHILRWTVMPAEGGNLGFLNLPGFTAQLWKRKADSDGVASWEMGRTIELDKLLSLNSDSDKYLWIQGFAEDNNLVFLDTAVSLFIVQFESLQFKKLTKPEMVHFCHPFESVYAAGI